MQIEGKVFIVTGAASGLGEGTARMLAANGAKVVVADMQAEKGEAVAREIGGMFVKCDVTQEADGQAAPVTMKTLPSICMRVSPECVERTIIEEPDEKKPHRGGACTGPRDDPGATAVVQRLREAVWAVLLAAFTAVVWTALKLASATSVACLTAF